MASADTRPRAGAPNGLGMLSPHILVVDDERQIHSSLRLRLGPEYRLTSASSPKEALAAVARHKFDLCFVDIHMPEMDGLALIETARAIDPALSYVILSGHGSEENLRRAIPLQVLDFLSKPLPDKSGFEKRVPDWVDRTRVRRTELQLARSSGTLIQDLEVARIERDVELTASAAAREALLQTASLLTTTQALLLSAQTALEALPRSDSRITGVLRSLVESRRYTESAANVADGYFSSAYADREASPALVNTCTQHAIGIALRNLKADERRQRIDFVPLARDAVLADLTGIDFLLMLVPALMLALEIAGPGSTVQVRCEETVRLDQVFETGTCRKYLWVNRRHSATRHPGVLLSLSCRASALEEEIARAWLRGEDASLRQPSRGLLRGIQQAKALLGIATKPFADRFATVLCLRI